MRFLTSAAAAAALFAFQAAPVLAQTTTPPAETAPAMPAPAPAPAVPPATAVPEATAPAGTMAPAPAPTPHKAMKHAKRMTMAQRFANANTAKNGHLTLGEAKAAKWTYVTRHFSAMDKEHKGYVTEADIHAYAHAQYVARHASAKPTAPAAVPAAPAAPQ